MKENDEYLKAQELFLKNGDAAAWSLMWSIGILLSKKLIRKTIRETSHKMSVEDVEDKALDACEYVLRRYRKDYGNGKQYKITSSPCSAFRFGVIHALYYENQCKRKKDLMSEAVLFCDFFKDSDRPFF